MTRGFTLMEVLVALAIAALVVLLCAQTWAGLLHSRRALETARMILESDMNGERWLAEGLRSAATGDSGSFFSGGPREASWSGRMWVVRGWRERRRLRLHWSGRALVLDDGQRRIVVSTPADSVQLEYLPGTGLTTAWTPTFDSPVSVPVAMRVRLARAAPDGLPQVDTLVLAVGPRP